MHFTLVGNGCFQYSKCTNKKYRIQLYSKLKYFPLMAAASIVLYLKS